MDSYGDADGFVTRVHETDDGNVTLLCTEFLDNSSDDRIYDLSVGVGQNLFSVGETVADDSLGTTDIIVAELQMDAEEGCLPVVSANAYGGMENDVGNGVSFDIDGNIYLTGTSYGFDGDEINNQDAFLAMLCEDNDADGVCNVEDLCLDVPNGPEQGTCSVPIRTVDEHGVVQYAKIPCNVDSECLVDSNYFGYCSNGNEDNDGDGWGDACDNNDDVDALEDWFEANYHYDPITGDVMLDPLNSDTNNDGTLDSNEDFDPEGLPNFEEQEVGTDPYWADSDKDNWSDLHELQINTDPTDSTDAPSSDYFKTNGIYVDINNGNDYFIGTKIGNDVYAVKTLHMAVERLHMLDPEKKYTIHIAPGTYSVANGELRTPLIIHQDVILLADEDVYLDGFVPEGDPLGTDWKTALHFSRGAENIE